MKVLEWNVICEDMNGHGIKQYNIFHHASFNKEVQKLLTKCKDQKVFAEELRRSLMYYFWSKCEWEIIISPWMQKPSSPEMKVDVYWQVMMNWQHFVGYVWSSRATSTRSKKYEQKPEV